MNSFKRILLREYSSVFLVTSAVARSVVCSFGGSKFVTGMRWRQGSFSGAVELEKCIYFTRLFISHLEYITIKCNIIQNITIK